MTGGFQGVHSVLYFNPEEKFGFVVLCNGNTENITTSKMNNEIVRVLYNHFIKSVENK